MSNSDSGSDPGQLDETYQSPDVPIDSQVTHGHDGTQEPKATLDSGSQPTKFASTFEEASIGRYEILGEIARGGMGVVYKALDKSLNRTVALKMILSGRFASERDVRRFYQEAESAANLDHPGIVPVYEVGEHDGHHYFTMKLMDGGSLAEAMAKVREDPKSSAEMISKIARAVHHAHQRGILHRDLKPANILLDSDGNPMVADLGLAKDTASDKNDITRSGAILGSPAYMSPEQAAGQSDVTTAADIYAIGAMLYELLAERTPHVGETPIELIRKVLDEDIASPRAVNAKTDRTLALICMKCLARDPADRYSSAGALADDLDDHWLAGEPVSVRPPSFGSTISNFLTQNFRSVIGVMLVSVLVGSTVAIAFWNTSPYKRDGLAFAKVYDVLPHETKPTTWAPNLKTDTGSPLFILPALFLVLSLGLLNALITKPESVGQALAIGIVSGLVVMLSIYTIAVGPASVEARVLSARNSDVRLLSQMALSPDHVQERARRTLFRRRLDLKLMEDPTEESLESKDPGEVIYKKLRADGLLLAPSAILSGMLVSALMSLLPVVGGTCLATHLVRRKQHVGWATFSYFEAMVGALVLSITVGAMVAGLLMDLTGNDSYWPGPFLPGVFLVCVSAVILAVVRGWKWPVRILLHACWITALAFYYGEMDDMHDHEKVISQMLIVNDVDSAAERVETWVHRNPRNQNLRWIAGVVQAYRGDEDRYRHHCLKLLEAVENDVVTPQLDLFARMGLLHSSSPIQSVATEWGKDAYEFTDKKELWDMSARMLAAHREGDFEEVENVSAKVFFPSNPQKKVNLLCLRSMHGAIRAMSLRESGKVEEGNKTLRLAKTRFQEAQKAAMASDDPGDFPVRLLVIEMLLAEAQR